MGLTPEAATCVGRSEAQLIGVDCRERLSIPKTLIEAVETSLATQAPRQIEISSPDSTDRWMEFQIHPFAAGATITWNIVKLRAADQAPSAQDWPRRRAQPRGWRCSTRMA